jgi:hypothetical protein
MHILSRYAPLIAVAAILATASPASARGPLPGLADYGLVFGDNATSLWGAGDQPDGGSDPAMLGAWTVTDVRYADKAADLHVRVDPPAWSLPVEAGPAVLFTTLSLMGGVGGDVGYQRVVSIGSTPLPACSSDPCVFETDVHVDLSRLPRIARQVDGFVSPSAAIGFTLVRTFAGGTWLQFLEGFDRSETRVRRTLQDPGTWEGRAEPMGLYPASTADGPPDEPGLRRFDYGAIVEQAREELGDTTVPAPSTPVRFIADFAGCSGPVAATLQTVAGDRVIIDAAGTPPRLDTTVDLPVGTTWRVGQAPDGAVSFDVGPKDLLVAARYPCAEGGSGTVTDVAVAEIVEPLSTASPAPGMDAP